jgi:hypothetical protein
VPAYSPFAGRLGAVDLELIAAGRLRRLEDAAAVVLEKRDRRVPPTHRDPEVLVDLMLAVAKGSQ